MASPNRILIVDDEMATREICRDFLAENGFEAETASDGNEALQKLDRETYNILLSDIQMPKLDGVALLRESRKRFPEIEVILMTAYGGLPSAIEAIRFEAYDYLTKPISREILLNTVRRCIEKIELRRKLKETNKKLLEQERLAALGSVSAWLSHRMRNSLSVILMCSHYLRTRFNAPGDAETQEVVGAIIEKVKLLEKTTTEFINYSRSYDLQKVTEDVNVILADVIKSVSVHMRLSDVTLRQELSEGLPKIQCDPHILNEAFENVLMNAAQAIGEQKGQAIIVKSECVTSTPGPTPQTSSGEPLRTVAVTITNTGSVIPEANMERIFRPFFTTKDYGTGLGLAITKRIVEQHGGAISVESSEQGGKKTSIRIVFPVTAERPAAENAEENRG